jgi:hypothetical protein
VAPQVRQPFFARLRQSHLGHYFGVGIVHPVDDFARQPAVNEKLVDAPAKDFVDSKFDIRHIAWILNSRTTSSARRRTRRTTDKVNYAHGYLRADDGRGHVDVLNSALARRSAGANERAPS